MVRDDLLCPAHKLSFTNAPLTFPDILRPAGIVDLLKRPFAFVANDPDLLQLIPDGRHRQSDSGNKSQTVEIQVTHVGPDLQFATAEVGKSTAEGSKSSSDGPSAASSAEEKSTA
jgi:hypothetical protein